MGLGWPGSWPGGPCTALKRPFARPGRDDRTRRRGARLWQTKSMDDELIRQQVLHSLHESPVLDSSEIYVSVHEEKVALDGTVPSDGERRVAEDIAERNSTGDVHNHLRIHQAEHPNAQIEERF